MSKLLYIITSADRGGAQHYVLTLTKALGGTIAAGTEATWLFDEAKKQGIRTIPVKHLKRAISPLHDLLAIYELRKIIRAEKPDIVHLNSTKAGILGSLAIPSYVTSHMSDVRVRALYTVHGAIFNEKLGSLTRLLYGRLERMAALRRSFTIAVSKADYMAMRAYGGVGDESIKVIYNGVEPIDFLGKANARQQLGLPAEGLIIGTVANYYSNKGLDVLIKALAQLTQETLANVKSVVLLGTGPEHEKLQRLVKTHELEKVIQFKKSEINAARLLKAFDIFVLPSRKEGMPFALLEAMQAGLPIIATNVGGVPEVVGESGVLVESENPIKLAQAISNLVENRSEREKFSELAKEQAKKFSSEKMLAETKNVYEQIIK